MPHRLQLALALAIGVAGGFVVATFAGQPSPQSPPPLIESPGGLINGVPLRPVSMRVGDKTDRLGEGSQDPNRVIHVYFEASGVPVKLSFDPPGG